MEVELVIFGEPEAKQRPRVSMRNGVVRTYTPTKTTNYENLVRHEYTSKYNGIAFDRETPIEAQIIVQFGLNQGDFGKKGLNKKGKEKLDIGYCTKHKDLDNIVKTILDALNSVCYYDDKQIVKITAEKVWVNGSPKVYVLLREISK